MPYVYSRPYVYSFRQICLALRLFPALRLFQTLEYIELTEPPRTSLVLLKVHCKDMIAPITHVCYFGHTQYAELLKWTDFLRVLCLLCSQLAVHALTQKRSKVHFRSNFLSQWSSVTILHPYYPLPVQGFWPLSSPLAWT